jgi:hypothetical protein
MTGRLTGEGRRSCAGRFPIWIPFSGAAGAGEEKPGGSRNGEEEAADEVTLVEASGGTDAPGEDAAGPAAADGAVGARRRSSILLVVYNCTFLTERTNTLTEIVKDRWKKYFIKLYARSNTSSP